MPLPRMRSGSLSEVGKGFIITRRLHWVLFMPESRTQAVKRVSFQTQPLHSQQLTAAFHPNSGKNESRASVAVSIYQEVMVLSTPLEAFLPI